ncbi:helix-turn-helix domain-containing protein [Clostridium perfringens]|uniref:helix-turn-helix domain-containing protein n=1 Tax=Clostridium perfringens TaxID=1502 RepID=UPI001ABB96C8|nr:helix-turn-helix domain-containing protein [Clostridium perfringens]MBO3363294.1 MarR family transcriptional regulator [Clostridium perfringens]
MSGKEVLSEGFTQIPNKLIKLKGLDCTEKMILINFMSYGENIYPSITRVCKELEISRSTCIRKIKSLQEKGFLEITKNKSLNGDYDNNSYKVVSNLNYLVSKKDYLVSELNHGSIKNIPQVVSELDSNNTNKIILNNNINNIYSPLENEIYYEEVNKTLEKDLLNKIKSKYSKELIKEELEKLKDKGFSNLELLKELDKNLSIKNKIDKTDIKVKKDKYSEDSKEYKLSVLLRDLILRRDENSRCKNADMQKWSKDIDLLHRKDNRSYEDIEKIIRWCQQDNFWKANILSTHKLREKFDSLYQKAFYENKSFNNNNLKKNNLERSNSVNGECWYFKESL